MTTAMLRNLVLTYQPADAKNWGVFVDVRYADLNPKVETVDGKTSLN